MGVCGYSRTAARPYTTRGPTELLEQGRGWAATGKGGCGCIHKPIGSPPSIVEASALWWSGPVIDLQPPRRCVCAREMCRMAPGIHTGCTDVAAS
jgi:hypothetical protein